jgi:hypothetical protein
LIADANPPLGIDFSNYYNKQTTDTLLDAKANSTALANYYTTSQVDTALALKQNKTDLEANYYTKAQVDNQITKVATGGTVSFR